MIRSASLTFRTVVMGNGKTRVDVMNGKVLIARAIANPSERKTIINDTVVMPNGVVLYLPVVGVIGKGK